MDRRDVLLGIAAALSAAAGIYGVADAQAIAERSPGGGGTEPDLDATEQALVAAMAECIIPKTDTPGAIAAGVPEFLGMIFSDWLLPAEQTAFRTGLQSYQSGAQAKFGRDFVACTPAQQTALLLEWDKEVGVARRAHARILPPFALFKALTVVGYYTSHIGQNEELKMTMYAGQAEPNGPTAPPAPFRI